MSDHDDGRADVAARIRIRTRSSTPPATRRDIKHEVESYWKGGPERGPERGSERGSERGPQERRPERRRGGEGLDEFQEEVKRRLPSRRTSTIGEEGIDDKRERARWASPTRPHVRGVDDATSHSMGSRKTGYNRQAFEDGYGQVHEARDDRGRREEREAQVERRRREDSRSLKDSTLSKSRVDNRDGLIEAGRQGYGRIPDISESRVRSPSPREEAMRRTASPPPQERVLQSNSRTMVKGGGYGYQSSTPTANRKKESTRKASPPERRPRIDPGRDPGLGLEEDGRWATHSRASSRGPTPERRREWSDNAREEMEGRSSMVRSDPNDARSSDIDKLQLDVSRVTSVAGRR